MENTNPLVNDRMCTNHAMACCSKTKQYTESWYMLQCEWISETFY